MYKKVSSSLNFCEREQETLEFWKEEQVFSKSVKQNEGGKEFSFYDGPPTANGKPHIGHILTRVMKDIIPRYKTMKGFHVQRKAGWDTHGLPVELEVEKQLKLDGKQEIEKYGVEPFIKKCKESVWKYKGEWERMSQRVGYWVDMDDPYITYDDKYIESVWWSLKEIDKKGLLYKGHKIVPYCPRCGTALSSHEVAQGYKDVKEKSLFVKFRALSEKQDNTFFLAWTTTPWTLPSNTALCVNPKENYALIEAEDGCRYILAESLVKNLFENYKTLSVKKGKEYERAKYAPLYDFAGPKDAAVSYYVTCGDFVTLTDGSGIVHIAPAFGEDDSKVGKAYSLPFLQMVDDRGNFVAAAAGFAGKFAKDADKDILIDLKKRGLLFKELMYEHSYPYCWRCDTPLLYYARKSWFIKTTALKDNLLKNNASVNWMPESIGTGRMGNFLDNVVDWGVSRERYWGTPLPVWECADCGEKTVIGSKAELIEKTGAPLDIELHKPYVDQLTMKCKCGKTMRRTPEVIDCWYDSGAMPFAQYHFPFENKELFDTTFPADFISEAVDQTRGWFYTLLAIGTLVFDKAPFKNCIVLGHVNDKDGQKMSKHKGNVVDPWTVLDKQGADAVRWYFYTVSSPWLPSRFYEEAVSEAQRKFMGTLWNTYSFYVLYAEIDGFDPKKYKLADCRLTLMDKWILSGLNSLIEYVDGGLEKYKITESARAIQDFTDKLSNWYVRRSRERYWGPDMDNDKIAAYMTLYTVLNGLIRLSAPFTPFIAENIYQNIVRSVDKAAPVSVHLTRFPKADKKYIDKALEKGMDLCVDIAVSGRAARNAAAIKNRQPLAVMYFGNEGGDKLDKSLIAVIADELNVKEAVYKTDLSEYSSYELKPQLKTLGPKYGALLGAIRELLSKNANTIMSEINAGKAYTAKINGTDVTLTRDDLLISVINKDGYSSADKVVLDIRLTEELITEGYAREITSRIQTMRKEAGFEVTDHITVHYKCGGALTEVFKKCGKEIAADTLSDKMSPGENLSGFVREQDINGQAVVLSLAKA